MAGINIGERMAKLETQITTLTKSMDENRLDHKIIFDKLDHFIECADQKYVSKWTLTVVIGAMTLLITVVGIVMGVN